ncbi:MULTISPECIES: peptidylprolyl isomerase [unclassified Marinobacterium]|jgi:FKBP-type peptidyl-prolyl cis-trans isomerase SlpA|uniref:FKBP-type peptidyl-prolyl cis-trans isomerase n=1 Tax=unclassified Marinobacterium TaxID=2644139 RepID=UPI001569A8B6|nr:MULTISPECIES: peptidylprolyl isomerase [unclassified Marinobacterium]NRP15276.1 FKBP-type 16 kDa peptidyl-prolyl cis-trans isomerase [Marinobacterium sp. xm-a-152]NRP52918.1 FKBP-type 16 kDa peptidyl-prolyl cis-trans isomerase [Marinobacterium sp. xm-v-242]NRP77499.1 FKBP-type 16 kDa peptidyl-prolyl cis-trans isomerase [Marinobacterium sp. xm-m-383]NRP94680.1 FKBP-type 16 kDa peptidyl-prolyl cis-trans isomerase [Marinobacterium sp. xm-g-59]
MSELTIEQGRKVTMHFAIKLTDGQIVDSNFEGAPVEFEVGDGNIPEGFEAALSGLKVGDHLDLTIDPERGFGQHNPSNIQTMKRSDFKDMELEPGLVISFQEPGGELPGVIVEFDDERVEVDFNHPLAGKTILFEVQVLNIQ